MTQTMAVYCHSRYASAALEGLLGRWVRIGMQSAWFICGDTPPQAGHRQALIQNPKFLTWVFLISAGGVLVILHSLQNAKYNIYD